MTITFTVPGLPVAQPRQRHAMIAGHVRNYVPSKHAIHDFKASVKIAAAGAYRGSLLIGPLEVTIRFVWPCSSSRRKAERGMQSWRAKKPDIDNLCKAVFDALNGVLFHDDAQIAGLHASKIEGAHGEQARTEIEIETRGVYENSRHDVA